MVCPGCGLALPGEAGPPRRRMNASGACWQLYGEVLAHESEHLARLGRLHQLTVDTYGAQHAGGPTPAISTAFGLIGLHLALEEGMTGLEVRAAHQQLAGGWSAWPPFTRPEHAASTTVYDVAVADSPKAHEELVGGWARSVWASWSHAHAEVRRLVYERLPAEMRLGPEPVDRPG